ncbi:MAG: GtrA family protein [Nocardioidaceae bacterium]
MRGHPAPDVGKDKPGDRQELGQKILRYLAGSVVATVCSEAAFLLLYGALEATPAVASAIGWLAGAVPNYWLNRTWTWRRRGRPSLTGEVLPYVAIVLGTVLLAAVTTSFVDAALAEGQVSSGVRLALVGGTFLMVYGVVFLLRFFLLDQLFRRADARSPQGNVRRVSANETV